MKKKLLFVTLYLHTGGVEKSLLALLSSLDYEKYDVDLLLFDHHGVLLKDVPPQVNLLPPLFDTYATPLFKAAPLLLKSGRYRLLIAKGLAAILAKFSRGVGTASRWAVYRHTLASLQDHYDVAVSYLDFFCNYYVTEKVTAEKKIVYNHMDYASGNGWPCQKLERQSFSKCQFIVSVAESSRQSLAAYFPEFQDKIQVIHNSVPVEHVRKLAFGKPVELMNCHAKFKITTVARLVEEKGVFLAIEACKKLVELGYKISWFLVGDGPLQDELQARVKKYGLDQNFILLGEKSNPYPYMAYCDVYVQPSTTEAHCVAVEEAMALCRPIVVTDIPSFRCQISHEESGLLAAADADGITESIKRLIDSRGLKEKFINHLLKAGERNKEELGKFNQLIEC